MLRGRDGATWGWCWMVMVRGGDGATCGWCRKRAFQAVTGNFYHMQ